MQIPGLFKRIAVGVAVVVGTAFSIYGFVSAARDVKSWGLPTWAWLIIGWLLMVGTFAYIMWSLWQDNRRLRADPRVRWETLSEDGKRAISTMDSEMEHLITITEASPKNIEAFMRMALGQVRLQFEEVEDTLKSASDVERKAFIDDAFRIAQSQVQDKSNPFFMLSGSFLTLMDKWGMGLESIKNDRYRAAYDELQTVVRERGSSKSVKAHIQFITLHETYYGYTLLIHYMPSMTPELEEITATFAIFVPTVLKELRKVLSLSEVTLIESIASCSKETDERS